MLAQDIVNIIYIADIRTSRCYSSKQDELGEGFENVFLRPGLGKKTHATTYMVTEHENTGILVQTLNQIVFDTAASAQNVPHSMRLVLAMPGR